MIYRVKKGFAQKLQKSLQSLSLAYRLTLVCVPSTIEASTALTLVARAGSARSLPMRAVSEFGVKPETLPDHSHGNCTLLTKGRRELLRAVCRTVGGDAAGAE